jgi:hypothetical protein
VVGDNNNYGIIRNCSSNAIVKGPYECGGIVGISFSGTVENCYALGAVTGTGNATSLGGMAGCNNGTLQSCYATGNVVGKENIGGLVGWNNGIVQNCYTKGDAAGNISIGGVVGRNAVGSTVQNCYATGKVSGTTYDIGGVIGLNNAIVRNCAALNWSVTLTANNLSIARVAGYSNGTLTNNNARSTGMVLTNSTGNITPVSNANGVHGANVAIGTALAVVFSGWNGTTIWNIPAGNLVIGGQLPTLMVRPQSPVPTLP